MSSFSPEQIMEKVSTGKPYTLLLLTIGKPLPDDEGYAQGLQFGHLTHLFEMERDGKTSVFGPISNNDNLFGIIVFNTTDKDKIREWMADDPYIKGGYLDFELYDFFTLPGQTIRQPIED